MVFQGSKRLIAKYIVPFIQKTIEENNVKYFYDMCVGGAHIIEQVQCENKIGGDINSNLIALYNYALGNPQWPKTITREDWNRAKDHPEECEPWFVALVQYFASYSARGFSGGYCLNSERDHYGERLKNFQRQLPLLKDCNFEVIDIIKWKCPNSGSCIYIDPPYQNTKKYDKINFDYEQFWDNIRKLSKDNYVFVSEQTAPDDFKAIWSKEVRRTVFGHKTSIATESLWTIKGD